ncbi:uncharacterized protein LOC109717544 [Ananas comosus]|uniref:Uncharacterized protein LOC109717544 n=1 Tax=Ananas comosus TaxID=4615 RepID=A0A6P5FTI4_ANACO|nr:uncharacterized protein LOC109717544 [Ananas comosus]
MYAEAGLEFPFFPGFSQDAAAAMAAAAAASCQHYSQLAIADGELLPAFASALPEGGAHMGNMVQTPIVSEYDLGGEGDLFKAPEPIIGEPLLGLDPMAAAISLMSGGNDVISETVKVAEMESIQNDQLLSDVFYECKKDLLEKSAIEESLCELLDIKMPAIQIEEAPSAEKQRFIAEGLIQKSVSSGCLNSMDWIHGCPMRPNFLDFQGVDFEAAFGMRRAYSEGDIQNLGNNSRSSGSATNVSSSSERPLTITDMKIEERRQKLSRYRTKKTKRNFGRKIKYACRKALADSQPRVRGRFAKTDQECESTKQKKSM